MRESLQAYLSSKRDFEYKSKHYYKLKNYKHQYYVPKEVVETLTSAPREVVLEQNQKIKNPPKGLIKWDPNRKRIMVSENKIRVHFEPYDIV